MMETSWKSNDISHKFDKYNDMLEDILGFSFLFEIIKNDKSIKTILDYGCGPGKVSERLVSVNPIYNITAVDESKQMLNIAKNKRLHPRITYKLITNNSLYFIDNNSIDCAILCFVIINNGTKEKIYSMIDEINRKLKIGGRLLILDSNPNAIGINFATFRNGDLDILYENGSRKKQYLKLSNSDDLVLNDFYWSLNFYETLLKCSNFKLQNIIEPKIKDLQEDNLIYFENKYQFNDWNYERKQAPFIIFESIKAVK